MAPRGHNSIATDLRAIFAEGRPIVERWLQVAEEFSCLRDAATARGIDWSQVKALLKAQVQDERDGDATRVTRMVEKAECASSYAKLLGLGGNLNEKKYSEVSSPDIADGGETSSGSAVDADALQSRKPEPPQTAFASLVISTEVDTATDSSDAKQAAEAAAVTETNVTTSAASVATARVPGEAEEEKGRDQAQAAQQAGIRQGNVPAASHGTPRPATIPAPTFDELEIPEFMRRSSDAS